MTKASINIASSPDDLILGKLHELGNHDDVLEFSEVQGQTIRFQEGESLTIDSEAGWDYLQQVVEKYRANVGKSCSRNFNALWKNAKASTDLPLVDSPLQSDCGKKCIIGKIELKPGRIEVQYINPETAGAAGTLLMDVGSNKLFFLPADPSRQKAQEPIKTDGRFSDTLQAINDHLQQADLTPEVRRAYRQILINHNKERARLVLHTPENSAAESKKGTPLPVTRPVQGFPEGNLGIPAYSSYALSDEETQSLRSILHNLAPEQKEYLETLAVLGGRVPVQIKILSGDEFKKQTDGDYHMFYSSADKTLYIPQQALKKERTLFSSLALRHELSHFIFDSMTPDSPSARFAIDHPELHRRLVSADKVDALAGGMLVFSGIGAITIGATVTTAGIHAALKMLAIGSATATGTGTIGGAWLWNAEKNAKKIDNGDSLLEDEYTQLQKIKNSNPQVPAQDYTVSIYAYRNIGEFSAETLAAFLTTENDQLEMGLISPKHHFLISNRDDLKAKHPKLYLAYTLFFDKQSPIRFKAQIFRHWRHFIGEALRLNQGNVDLAREQLFAQYWG